MKLEQRYTAAQVARYAIGFGCAAFLVITALNLPLEQWISGRAEFWAEVALLMTAVGAVVAMYYALAAFARGVEQDVWDKASLEPIKAFVEKRRWIVLICSMALCMIGFIMFDLVTHWPRRHHINASAGYFWMSPFLAIMQIRGALNRKVTAGKSIWTGEVKPLVSEHWGNRETSAR